MALNIMAEQQQEGQAQPARAPAPAPAPMGAGGGEEQYGLDSSQEEVEQEEEVESEHEHEGIGTEVAVGDELDRPGGLAEPNDGPVVRTVITHVSSEAKSAGTLLTVSIQCFNEDGNEDKTVVAFVAGCSDSHVACLESEGEGDLPCVYLVPLELMPPKTMAILKQATSRKGSGQLLGTVQRFEASDFVECTVKAGYGQENGAEVWPEVCGGGGASPRTDEITHSCCAT